MDRNTEMTPGEILQKAVEKANKNMPEGSKLTIGLMNFLASNHLRYYHLIFNKTFAKAFWGEEETKSALWKIFNPPIEGEPVTYVGTYVLRWKEENQPTVAFAPAESPAWQYHLQQMVLEEDPIQYLSKFI